MTQPSPASTDVNSANTAPLTHVTVTSVHTYPVKSLQGITLASSELKVQGLAHDRQWMVVDGKGRFVTQRQLPAMATISTRLESGHLCLGHPQRGELRVALDPLPRDRCEVTVWGDTCAALDEGSTASEWLTCILGRFRGAPLRLVRFAPDFRREVDPNYLHGDAADTQFSDGFPVLVTNQASLQALNEELEKRQLMPVPMARFRPNLVIEGLPAWTENGVDLLSHDSGFALALRKPCQRCPVITVDQNTGRRDSGEPLKTLTDMGTVEDKDGAYFGQNGILLGSEAATIKVGDKLRVSFKPD